MVLHDLQAAIYEFRENDPLNRYPSKILIDPVTLVNIKKEIDPYLILDQNLIEKSMSFWGVKVIESNIISGFKVE